jgi:hypothetical protein
MHSLKFVSMRCGSRSIRKPQRLWILAVLSALAAIAMHSPAAAYSVQAQQYCHPKFRECHSKCAFRDVDCGMACADMAQKCMEEYDKSHPTSVKPDGGTPAKPKGGIGGAAPPSGVKP